MLERFVEFLHVNERDKLYYFMLALSNPQEVLIIRSPSDTAARKKFLGYEWSSAKGNEGIKYLSSAATPAPRSGEEDETLDEEDARILANLFSLNAIETPLYDPNDPAHSEKLATLVTCNFGDEALRIPEALQEFTTTAQLADMIDFSRSEFNKAISLTPKKSVVIESQWPLVRLGEIADIQSGGTPKSDIADFWDGNINWATLVDTKEKYLFATERKITNKGLENSSAKLMPANTVLFSSRATIGAVSIAKVPTATNQGYKNFVCDETQIHYEYLYEVLKEFAPLIEQLASGTTFKEVSKSVIENFKIPLPPLEVQQQIVAECETVDAEVKQAQAMLAHADERIKNALDNRHPIKKLEEVCEMKAGKFVSASDIHSDFDKGLYPCYGGNGLRGFTETYTHDGVFPLIGRQGALCGNVMLAQGKFHATEHAVVVSASNLINVKWFYYQLTALNLNQYKTGVAQPGLSVKNLNQVCIPLPPLETQQAIVEAIEAQERIIATAKQTIDAAPAKKAAILKHYM